MSQAWGSEQTQFFFELTPDRVCSALEERGFLPTGRISALNSFENRVYEVEFEKPDESDLPQSHVSFRKVLKFYRPGRWNEAQILEEHAFLQDLIDAEIPVVAPEKNASGETLYRNADGIFFSIFPKTGGRAPDELDDEQCLRLGRLLARIHVVGKKRPFQHRIALNAVTYGRQPLETLLAGDWIPVQFREPYREIAEKIIDRAEREIDPRSYQRIHGDCHLGNLLWGSNGAFFLDFDDAVMGPAVQDFWLFFRERNDAAFLRILDGYEEILDFDRAQLRWVELLRSLRFIHYTCWIAKRWDDPAFPQAFPQFGTFQYWKEEVEDLEKQWQLLDRSISS